MSLTGKIAADGISRKSWRLFGMVVDDTFDVVIDEDVDVIDVELLRS